MENQKKFPVDNRSLHEKLKHRALYTAGKIWEDLLPHEKFNTVGYTVRDRLVLEAIKTQRRYQQAGAKRAYYLSMEFLIGRSLRNNLINSRFLEESRKLLKDLDEDLEAVMESERDAALGNGGLGRLAACFIDSLATMDMPGFGYGILYDYGLFKQVIKNGHQTERPDYWRLYGSPWLIERTDEYALVQLGGKVKHNYENGVYSPEWVDYELIIGLPFDLPIIGYGGKTVNYLRLFSAKSSEDFDMEIFNEGDYIKAVEKKVLSETVSKVLYPNDQPEMGQKLRLIQEYFLVTCSLQDIFRQVDMDNLDHLHEQVAIHLNDTHPSLSIPELMRLLMDIYRMPWEKAWDITTKTISYTNHTLLPEALEKWPVPLLEQLLPRHLEIIYEINWRFLEDVKKAYPADGFKLSKMSIIEEGPVKHVRMAHLSIIGSHSVNGVAEVHTDLLKKELVPDFYEFWPDKFNNKTNGVTPRRWILSANQELSKLITDSIGERWITHLDELKKLEKFTEDEGFVEEFAKIKQNNKYVLEKRLKNLNQLIIDPEAMFDVQVKRIHEYKRQLLNVLHILYEYLSIKEDGVTPAHPRTVIFAGKAAPGYFRAKDIIYLIHKVGDLVNEDPDVSPHLKVIFVPDYNVTAAEYIIPATDLSEQISTAGFEASGTSNMKFAMNGALTIGTLDGANIEMKEETGDENIFIFGNTVDGIRELNMKGVHPRTFYDANETIRRIMDLFLTSRFSPGENRRFDWVFHALVDNYDPYFHLADLQAYIDTHKAVSRLFTDQKQWTKKAILNTARMGKFSSDRTIREYASEIWGIHSV